MSLADLIRKPLRRLNPHRGMVINVDSWQEAHGYHRIHQRLHALSMHRPGIVVGMDVVGWNPPDNTVVVSPGIAVDSAGNTIVVSESQRLTLQAQEEGTFYLVLQYTEVPLETSPSTPSGDHEPTYLLEGFAIEILLEAPEDGRVEIARVRVSGAETAITDPVVPELPGVDEIDSRFRPIAGPRPLGEVGVGLVPLEEGPDGQIRHLAGAMRMIQAVNSTGEYHATFKGPVNLEEEITNCQLLLMSGSREFTLNPDWIKVLSTYLDRGGVLLGESCGEGAEESSEELPFQQSFFGLADQLGRRLSLVERNNPLLNAYHLFGEAPEGLNGAPQLVAGDGIIYSTGDYGCLWVGGGSDSAASRESIRSATELGINMGVYAAKRAHLFSVKLVAQ